MLNTNYTIDSLTLRADDETRMRSFYRDVLKLVEKQENKNSYSYAYTQKDKPFLTLIFNGRKNVSPHKGLYHFALLFPDSASLASLIERLILINYPLGSGDHDVSEAFYLNDPNGNGIELYHDRPKALWEWHDNLVKMGTKEVDLLTLLKTKKAAWAGFPDEMKVGHIHFVGDNITKGDTFFIDELKMALTSTIADSAHFYSHNHYHHHHAYNTWLGTNLTQREYYDNGLVSWTISVDSDYFTVLQSNNRNTSNQPGQIWLTDPFGSTLIIHEKNYSEKSAQ